MSYPHYAAQVSGSNFATDDISSGKIDVFVNLHFKTLEAHPGLARTIIGALLNAIYNRDGKVAGRTLFLLDEWRGPAICASWKPPETPDANTASASSCCSSHRTDV